MPGPLPTHSGYRETRQSLSMKSLEMDQATRTSWKTLPPPHERAPLVVSEIFLDLTGDRMREGHIPVDMDDRWFIYF